MSEFQIYHNPRCSKSRSTLALLQESGVEPDIILYLETPPDEATLRGLLQRLGKRAGEIVRKGEDDYKAVGLSSASNDDDIIAAMVRYPKLIERPIVVRGEQAVLGRPPENVLALLA